MITTAEELIRLCDEASSEIFLLRYKETIRYWINPGEAGLNKAGGKRKEIRFIGDPFKKRVYVWEAFDAIHHDFIVSADFITDKTAEKYLRGIAQKKNNKWITTAIEKPVNLETNWSFIENRSEISIMDSPAMQKLQS